MNVLTDCGHHEPEGCWGLVRVGRVGRRRDCFLHPSFSLSWSWPCRTCHLLCIVGPRWHTQVAPGNANASGWLIHLYVLQGSYGHEVGLSISTCCCQCLGSHPASSWPCASGQCILVSWGSLSFHHATVGVSVVVCGSLDRLFLKVGRPSPGSGSGSRKHEYGRTSSGVLGEQ